MTIEQFETLKSGDMVRTPVVVNDEIIKLTAEVIDKEVHTIREVPNKPELTVCKYMVHIRVITPRKQFRNRTAWVDILTLEKGR